MSLMFLLVVSCIFPAFLYLIDLLVFESSGSFKWIAPSLATMTFAGLVYRAFGPDPGHVRDLTITSEVVVPGEKFDLEFEVEGPAYRWRYYDILLMSNAEKYQLDSDFDTSISDRFTSESVAAPCFTLQRNVPKQPGKRQLVTIQIPADAAPPTSTIKGEGKVGVKWELAIACHLSNGKLRTTEFAVLMLSGGSHSTSAQIDEFLDRYRTMSRRGGLGIIHKMVAPTSIPFCFFYLESYQWLTFTLITSMLVWLAIWLAVPCPNCRKRSPSAWNCPRCGAPNRPPDVSPRSRCS